MITYECFLCHKNFKRYKSHIRHPKRFFCSVKCRNKQDSLDGLFRIKQQVNKVHRGKVKLVDSTYTNTRNRCKFIDKDFGIWFAFPTNVAGGTGNPKRWKGKQKLDIAEVKKRIKMAHNNTITIVENTYIDMNTKCKFKDKDFGIWSARPSDVCNGSENMIRKNKFLNKDKTIPINEVKKRIKKVHGNVINIDESTYTKISSKAKFIDKDYGEWFATPASIILGQSHKKRGLANRSEEQKLQIKDLKKRLKKKHKDEIKIVECTYINAHSKAKFVDKTYGTWWTVPSYVLSGSGHPDGSWERQAKTVNNYYILKHWKTGQELVCVASYEKAVVEYLNINKINFRWQSKIFKMPDGHTYRPDMYLFSSKKWIEIKGYFRKDAKKKWDWFHKEYPNSELWHEKKLKKMRILKNDSQ